MGNCCSRLHELIFSGTATDRSDYSPIESFADSGRDGTAAGNSIGSYQYASSNGVNVAANGSNTTSHRNNHHNDVSNPGSLSSQIEIPTNVTISQPKSSTFHLNYELGQEIGIGSTSKCYTCTKKSTGTQYACKVIDKRHVEMKFSGLMEQFYLEIKVLKFLHHPNIIHLEDTFETSDRIYIIMERMMGGELFDYVVEKGTLSEIEASTIVRKITSAVAHMHGMNIIHRDLKPENLLLTHKGPNPEVKIIDFGLAKVVEAEQVASSFLGTKGYLAPEMLQRHSYDKAIDMWALGVIVFVLLCGCLPFDDDSSKIANESLARKKFTLRFPQWASNLSTSAKDLLHNLLDINPKTRFTAAQALNHPWVAGKTVQANSFLQSPSIMGKISQSIIVLHEHVLVLYVSVCYAKCCLGLFRDIL